MSLLQLAKRAHISKSNLSKLENGGVNMTVFSLCRLASAFDLTPSRLLEIALNSK